MKDVCLVKNGKTFRKSHALVELLETSLELFEKVDDLANRGDVHKVDVYLKNGDALTVSVDASPELDRPGKRLYVRELRQNCENGCQEHHSHVTATWHYATPAEILAAAANITLERRP